MQLLMLKLENRHINPNYWNNYLVRFLSLILISIYIFLFCTKNYHSDYIFEESLLILISNALLIWEGRRNRYLVLVTSLLFYLNYSIVYPNYFVNLQNFFTIEINHETTVKSVDILCVFNCLLLIFFPINVIPTQYNINNFTSSRILNIKFTLCILIILLIIFVTGIKRPSMEGGRADPSPIYEYSIILFILLFYFVKSICIRKILVIIGFLFALQNFINGGRISGIQFLICIYICQYSHRLKFKHILIFALPLFLILSLIGMVRTSILSGDFEMSNLLTSILKGGFALDTAYAAYYTSSIFVFMSDKVPDHLSFFIGLVAAIFIGYGKFPHLILQNEADKHLLNYKGGVYPFYFWFYFGWIGILLGSWIIGLYVKCMNNLAKPNRGLIQCIGVYAICFIFRWYLYTPYSLLRGTLFLSILYFVFKGFSVECTRSKSDLSIINTSRAFK